MPAVARLAAAVAICFVAEAADAGRFAPTYSDVSIVNAATNAPGPLAPLGLVSIYGKELSVVTRAITADDMRSELLPTTLIGTGVTVSIDFVTVPVLFVSPNQINFLIPGNVRPGVRKLQVTNNGKAGPPVAIEIADSSPGLFRMGEGEAIATHADGSLITGESPGMPGEVIILYAAGLGATQPAVSGLTITKAAATISARDGFAVLLNNAPVPDSEILYAGLTPGFAGLYQINCRLPLDAPANPEVRLRLPGQTSPPKLYLAVRGGAASLQ